MALACALTALTLTGCDGAAAEVGPAAPSAPDPVAVRVARVRRATLSVLYSMSATLRPERQATVPARTRGVVRELLVEEGAAVEADAPLAQLEDDEQRIERDRAVAVRDMEQVELERAIRIHAQKALSENELGTAHRERDEAGHRAAIAELALARTTIRAPFAGRVVRRHLDVGAMVGDGTPVFDLADTDPLHADVSVPERHVARLAPGQLVRLTADAARAVVPGRIERIAPAVDPATGTVKVTISVEAGCGLRPGAFARVDIVTDARPDVLAVPRSAFVQQAGRSFLFLLDGERVRRLEAVAGLEEGDLVEVLKASAPIPPDARVVILGAAALADGVPVLASEEAVAPVGSS